MFKRRNFLQLLGLLPFAGVQKTWAALPAVPDSRGNSEPAFRLAFGSCAEQYRPQPIWDVIGQVNPDAFVFLGDNIYADTADMKVMQSKYDELAAKPEFNRFRQKVPIYATWDDHDYGWNDVGGEYTMKEESKKLFMEFFKEPQDSARRQRPGIYDVVYFEKGGRRIQLILLDLRWFRSPLYRDERGHYAPNPDAGATLLGEEQWQWLESVLKDPADVRIIGSSTQFLAQGHRWEKWDCYPFERARLIGLIDSLRIQNLIVISGDMHYGELSKQTTPGGFELFELTSSALTRSEGSEEHPNVHRLATYDAGANFGLVTVDLSGEEICLELEVRDADGRRAISTRLILPG